MNKGGGTYMENNYFLISPNEYMDHLGRTFYKTASGDFEPVKDAYVEAEERYLAKHLSKEGRDL